MDNDLRNSRVGDNTAVVLEFIASCNQRDIGRMMSFFDGGSFYHNIPLQPITGVDAIREVVEPFFASTSKVDWVIKNIAETSNGLVLTERLDRFLIGEKWLELPVMGAFEVEDNIIRCWRDYFDLEQLRRGGITL